MAKSPWRNRIVGYSEEEPDQLLANPSNWRIHPAAQQNALSGVLKEVGLVQNVVANRTTGHLVDGHLRVMLAMRENQPVVPVTWVELSEEEEHLILAALDPLAAMATADAGALDALLSSVQSGEAAVTAMLAELAEGAGLYAPPEDDNYSRKIEPPIYRPTGPKPAVKDLYDPSRTSALIEDIETQEGLTDEERGFLIAAAQRHTVIRFDRVAEYYAHSDAATQRLMEDSALVIIDFNRAIELGFVTMTERIAELVREEYGE